jgi:hypothetical protein
MKFFSPYDPRILKKQAFDKPLRVFLCGPGVDSTRYGFRDNIRNALQRFPNVEIVLGEDLDPKKHMLKRSDLQSAETTFAHMVDFTVLLLESPGAIAELGTFSMMPNVRPRLFVMVPSRFYASESYIARGPLSIIAKEHVNNIIYFNETKQSDAIRSLDLPVTLFKYANAANPFFSLIRSGPTKYVEDQYLPAFKKAKDEFFDLVALMAVIILELPTFPMLVSLTKFDPKDLNKALSRLYKKKSIQRTGSVYRSLKGYSDPKLQLIDTTFLSKTKSSFMTAA